MSANTEQVTIEEKPAEEKPAKKTRAKPAAKPSKPQLNP